MIQRFLDYIAIEKKYSERTVEAYRNDLHAFCAFLGWQPQEYDPKRVTEDDIKTWVIALLDNGSSPRSVKRYLSSLHSFYRFLLRNELYYKDITRLIVTPKLDKPLPVFFKPSEMQKATEEDAAADDFVSVRDCLIIEMFYQTGMRQAEMLGLQDTDVDCKNKQIRIFGKRRKERIVPIGDNLVKLIHRYLSFRDKLEGYSPSVGAFFVHKNHKGEVVSLYKELLYKIVCTRMGEVSTLKKHSPHVLRHTFATTMLDNGADIRTIQQLLGHASLAATQVYTHTTFEQIRKIYDATHPRSEKHNKSEEK